MFYEPCCVVPRGLVEWYGIASVVAWCLSFRQWLREWFGPKYQLINIVAHKFDPQNDMFNRVRHIRGGKPSALRIVFNFIFCRRKKL